MFAPQYEQQLWVLVFGGCALLAFGLTYALFQLVRQARRIDAIERRLGLVSDSQRTQVQHTQQVVAKATEEP